MVQKGCLMMVFKISHFDFPMPSSQVWFNLLLRADFQTPCSKCCILLCLQFVHVENQCRKSCQTWECILFKLTQNAWPPLVKASHMGAWYEDCIRLAYMKFWGVSPIRNHSCYLSWPCINMVCFHCYIQ